MRWKITKYYQGRECSSVGNLPRRPVRDSEGTYLGRLVLRYLEEMAEDRNISFLVEREDHE